MDDLFETYDDLVDTLRVACEQLIILEDQMKKYKFSWGGKDTVFGEIWNMRSKLHAADYNLKNIKKRLEYETAMMEMTKSSWLDR